MSITHYAHNNRLIAIRTDTVVVQLGGVRNLIDSNPSSDVRMSSTGRVVSRETLQSLKREQLVAAAASEIAAKGADNVRLRDVAARCDVTTGMLQYYFETRDELIYAAFEYGALKYVKRWRTTLASENGSHADLRELISQLSAEFSDDDSSGLWIELCAQSARSEDLQLIVQRVNEEWKEILHEAISSSVTAGTVSPRLSVETSTGILVALFDGLELSLATRSSTVSPQSATKLVGEILDLLLPVR